MTRYEIDFQVWGKPATAGSKTVFSYQRDGQNFVGVRPANPRQKPFMAAVAAAAADAAEGTFWADQALYLGVKIVRARPRSHFRTGGNRHLLRKSAPQQPTGKPDSLKVVRAIEDAMAGVIYRDDAQICHHTIRKTYGVHDKVIVVVGIWKGEEAPCLSTPANTVAEKPGDTQTGPS